MSVIEYHDFELEISSDPAGSMPQQYYGKVLRSPAGETPRCKVKFWFSEPGALAKLRGDLENAVLEIDDNNHHGLASRGERVLREFGQEVFRSIFVNTPSIQDIYARSKSKDLRIKLRIESAELAGLPWEYLYEENEMPRFHQPSAADRALSRDGGSGLANGRQGSASYPRHDCRPGHRGLA